MGVRTDPQTPCGCHRRDIRKLWLSFGPSFLRGNPPDPPGVGGRSLEEEGISYEGPAGRAWSLEEYRFPRSAQVPWRLLYLRLIPQFTYYYHYSL
jgi:hypothetical protein